MSTSAPRCMHVMLPKIKEDNSIIINKEESLLDQFKKDNYGKMIHLINKQPSWNNSIKSYVLKFSKKITTNSMKNFQLLDPNNRGNVIMESGKMEVDTFSMDITWPMSIFQAYGIALSSFNYS